MHNVTFHTEWKKSAFTAAIRKEKLTLNLHVISYILFEALCFHLFPRRNALN